MEKLEKAKNINLQMGKILPFWFSSNVYPKDLPKIIDKHGQQKTLPHQLATKSHANGYFFHFKFCHDRWNNFGAVSFRGYS